MGLRAVECVAIVATLDLYEKHKQKYVWETMTSGRPLKTREEEKTFGVRTLEAQLLAQGQEGMTGPLDRL